MRNVICIFSFVALVLTLLNGCGGDVENEILGKWKGNTNDFIFYPDKAFEHIMFHPKRISKGTFEIVDGNKVKLDYDKLNFDVVHTASISGDNLKLTNGDGKSARLKRVSDSK